VLVVLSPALVTRVPESALKPCRNLLPAFRFRWLHKAVLRSAGVVAMHDEEHAYAQTGEPARLSGRRTRLGRSSSPSRCLPSRGWNRLHLIAVANRAGCRPRWRGLVARGGGWCRTGGPKPLARVPENTLKYAVGILLTSLGTFWAAEGMGASWPLDFVSILGLVAVYLLASRLAIVSHQAPGGRVSFLRAAVARVSVFSFGDWVQGLPCWSSSR